jgi:hypothetical protein
MVFIVPAEDHANRTRPLGVECWPDASVDAQWQSQEAALSWQVSKPYMVDALLSIITQEDSRNEDL